MGYLFLCRLGVGFRRHPERWLFVAMVFMVALEILLLPNILIHPTLKDYAGRILMIRLLLRLIGAGGFLYFAWQRDFRFLPAPLATFILSWGLLPDEQVAHVLLNAGLMGSGGFHDYLFFVLLGGMTALAVWATISAARQFGRSEDAHRVTGRANVHLKMGEGAQLEFSFDREDPVQLAQAQRRIQAFLEQP